MAWGLLIIAGLLEAAWAIGLKYTHGFTRLWPSVGVAIGIASSMFLLATAAKTIPISTAYAVWVGIGTAGAVLIGIFVLGEAAPPGRVVCLVLLVLSIVGLKLTSG